MLAMKTGLRWRLQSTVTHVPREDTFSANTEHSELCLRFQLAFIATTKRVAITKKAKDVQFCHR
jgi:hypothetical protein